MNKNVITIFHKNIQLLIQMEKAVYFFRVQNYDYALRIAIDIINQFNSYIEIIFSESLYFNENLKLIDEGYIIEMLKELLDAQENRDYILLADLYEIQFIPFITNLQQTIIFKEKDAVGEENYQTSLKILEQTDPCLAVKVKEISDISLIHKQGYKAEYTSSGLFTLSISNQGKKYYVHSNGNAAMEAFYLVSTWYRDDRDTYIIYGLGLGYHIKELCGLNNSNYIEVYESDINVIRMACRYSDIINYAAKNNIKLIYDPDFCKIKSRIEEIGGNMEFVIHYPSLQILSQCPVKDKLENYFIQYSSVKNQLPLLNINFNRNIQHYDGFVDVLSDKFNGKSLFIVAAGPSLDKNFRKLKEVGEKGIILATGTVFKKLMKEGIKPDYVLVTDPNERVYSQISGYEDCDVPMIYLSTAFYGFAANYRGKKYLVCQLDYPKAEELAKKKGLRLYRTGGSVSTTALDIGITFCCKRIIFLGLDLAYTDNLAHASDTSRRFAADSADMRQVEDIHGKLIPTGRNLDIFRVWIENRIRDVKGIEFIDATEGGAKIHGMRIATLEEVLKEL